MMYKAGMRTKHPNPDFLNGVPELLILKLLSRRPMYGYQLVQAIRLATNGTLQLGRVASTRSSIAWKPMGCSIADGRRWQAGAGLSIGLRRREPSSLPAA